ncbi:class I SAM-dependent methyltransferase [Mumia zhuanghuii]|uniref:class I SAM-dependent methyltransferase n=1 Tax=Mumia zhuanghuii TaxID=2585211 RepID=UPI00362E79EF
MCDVAGEGALLDVAPSPLTSTRLAALATQVGVPYVGMDFDPAADNRDVDVQASLTSVPLADDSVGLLVCFHVLEHIPDDHVAMAEIRRVLAPSGLALVQVPARRGVPTDEDPSADVQERIARFGQSDHVRYYGLEDFEARLAGAGLKVQRVTMGDLYDELEADLLGILRNEPFWLCTTDAEVDVSALAQRCRETAHAAVRAMTSGVLAEREAARSERTRTAGQIKRLRSRVRTARRERDQATRREENLARRPEVRLASSLRRCLRRLRRVAVRAS